MARADPCSQESCRAGRAGQAGEDQCAPEERGQFFSRRAGPGQRPAPPSQGDLPRGSAGITGHVFQVLELMTPNQAKWARGQGPGDFCTVHTSFVRVFLFILGHTQGAPGFCVHGSLLPGLGKLCSILISTLTAALCAQPSYACKFEKQWLGPER